MSEAFPRLVVYDAILTIDLVDAVDDTTEIGGRTTGEREGGIDLALARSVAKGCSMRTIPLEELASVALDRLAIDARESAEWYARLELEFGTIGFLYTLHDVALGPELLIDHLLGDGGEGELVSCAWALGKV